MRPALDQLDTCELAFDGAGAPGQGEAVDDGVPVVLEERGEALDRRWPLAEGTRYPVGEVLVSRFAGDGAELVGEVTGGGQVRAGLQDAVELVALAVGQGVGVAHDPGGDAARAGDWPRWFGGGGAGASGRTAHRRTRRSARRTGRHDADPGRGGHRPRGYAPGDLGGRPPPRRDRRARSGCGCVSTGSASWGREKDQQTSGQLTLRLDKASSCWWTPAKGNWKFRNPVHRAPLCW